MEKLLVVFSGFNQRAVIAFLRSLHHNCINNYVIIASSEDDTIQYTTYSSKVFWIRKCKELNKDEIIQIILNIKKAFLVNELLIVPSTESLNRFILKNREELESFGCIIPLVNEELYETISDKHSFWELCSYRRLQVPEIVTDFRNLSLPFVAKPKKYYSNIGNVYSPIIVNNEQQYQRFIDKYSIDDFDIQEYVSGESYYLLYYFSKNGNITKYSQKNLAQQPYGKSILVAEKASIHVLEISEQYEALLKDLKFKGFIMIELRKNNDLYYMIEANPRLWGPSQFFVDSGVPIFEAFLLDYHFLEKIDQPSIRHDAKYLWSTGSEKGLLHDESCVWYSNGKEIVEKQWKEFFAFDVYCRKDTVGIYNREQNEGM